MRGLVFVFLCCLLLWLNACRNASVEDEPYAWDHAINFNWRFARGDHPEAIEPGFDDSSWERVDLPHDWAISGPFDSLRADGKTGKLPWRGEGWYRKHFFLEEADDGKRLQFLFDGVMSHPKVYLNGKQVGAWRYGYNSFWMDATRAARFGGDNVLVVHADTRSHGSRWYPGAGIYRKLSMRLVDPVHIPVWGLYLTTPEVSEQEALVHVEVDIENRGAFEKELSLDLRILDPDGRAVADCRQPFRLPAGEGCTETLELRIPNPLRWDVNHPYLYSCVAVLKEGDRDLHGSRLAFGVRTFRWTADDGFHLNGRRVQLQGVNLHHDHGPLGAAFLPRAMERQLEMMKDMGVNALRTSHNACAPEVLELCDRMGIIVYNELFDKYGPTAGEPCTTAEYIEQYAEAEVANFVRRDRNHPCVFLWSIGNEISDLLGDVDGHAPGHVATMVGYFEQYDTTRPTSMGCHMPSASEEGRHILDDLATTGWNYGRRYVTTRKAYPGKPLLYTESASAFGTRGAYKLPFPKAKTDWPDDGEMSAYMLSSALWSDIPEQEFEYMRIDTFVAGEFVWTGFDYLGEPTPVMKGPKGSFKPTSEGYQARSSYFGIVDLAGLPKDSYYNYRSLWNKDEHTVYLSPHWNWPERLGQKVPVMVYTDGDEAELFLNGQSLGRRKKADPRTVAASIEAAASPEYVIGSAKTEDYYQIVGAYRLIWPDVIYEPGELRVLAYKDGLEIGEASVRTAGEPAQLVLTADRRSLKADGMDLCYVTIEMQDERGNLCPLAMNQLRFELLGAARLAGVANGNQMGHDAFGDNTHPLFYGKAVAVLRSIPGEQGTAVLKVSCAAVPEATLKLEFR